MFRLKVVSEQVLDVRNSATCPLKPRQNLMASIILTIFQLRFLELNFLDFDSHATYDDKDPINIGSDNDMARRTGEKPLPGCITMPS